MNTVSCLCRNQFNIVKFLINVVISYRVLQAVVSLSQVEINECEVFRNGETAFT